MASFPRDSLQLVQSARRAGDPIFPRMPRREEPKATGAVVLLPEIGDTKALKKQARAGTGPLLFLTRHVERALPARDVVGSSLVQKLLCCSPKEGARGGLGFTHTPRRRSLASERPARCCAPAIAVGRDPTSCAVLPGSHRTATGPVACYDHDGRLWFAVPRPSHAPPRSSEGLSLQQGL